jgi:hypothetical protein
MLMVETVAKIGRAHFVQGKSIKAICRELRVSRKVVRSDATEFRYRREPRTSDAHPFIRRVPRAYDAVRRYARSWLRDHATTSENACVPLSFAPGEGYQFDWSHEVACINDTTVTVTVAHVRLCHSRMRSEWCGSTSSHRACGRRATRS